MRGEIFASKIEEYVRRFGGAPNFFGKVLDSFDFGFSIIRVEGFEVEVSNREDFFVDERDREKILEVAQKKERVVFEGDGVRVYFCPIFAKDAVVSVIRYELPKEKGDEGDEIFYRILQTSQDVVYRYDFVEDRFWYVSESVYTLLGFSLAEFVKMNYEDVLKRVHPDDLDSFRVDDLDGEESSLEREYRWKCKDGQYRWFLDKRTYVCDGEGKKVCVVGDIKDISDKKLAEDEREKLEARINYMRKKDVSEKVDLTAKERKVLWGFCRYPLLNDAELAKKLGLKRSTLTAIKNRLRKGRWIANFYIPNFNKLGCDYAGFFWGSVGSQTKSFDLDKIKSNKNVILKNFQDGKFFGFYVSSKILDFRTFCREFCEENEGVDFNMEDFFYKLDGFEFRDSSIFVNMVFGLGMKKDFSRFSFKNSVADLNINERRVFHAMVVNPDLSSAEIAKKVWASNPTVIKIRKRLLEEGIVYPYVAVDFRKLGFGFLGKISCSFGSEVFENPLNGDFDSRVLFRIRGERKITDFVLFRSEREAEQEVDMIREGYRKKGVYVDLESEIFPLQKRGKNILDFGGFVEDILFSEV